MILPYLDQAPIYNAINQDLTIFGFENRTTLAVNIATFSCPSDPEARVRDGETRLGADLGLIAPGERLPVAFTSYAGCFGSLDVHAQPNPRNQCRPSATLLDQADGCFTDVAPIRFATVTDGLGQTLFASEKSTTRYRQIDETLLFPIHGWRDAGNLGDTLFSTAGPPNMDRSVAAAAGHVLTRAASSQHPGGVNALMGDGSVRFIKDTVQSWAVDSITGSPMGATQADETSWRDLPRPGVWQALGSRGHGEQIDPGSF